MEEEICLATIEGGDAANAETPTNRATVMHDLRTVDGLLTAKGIKGIQN
jgi:hypothetical protein